MKMLDDCEKRLRPIIDSPDSIENASLSALSEYFTGKKWNLMLKLAVDDNDYIKSTKVVTKLMTSGFSNDSSGNQWVLGLKRLNDILKKK